MLRQLLIASPRSTRSLLIRTALSNQLKDAELIKVVRDALPPNVLQPFDQLLIALREWCNG